ncbi:hypothetical protein [Corynebacterium sp. HMSC14B06]|uniref:hypothetical protein n=1 Tax=Corynebacterium sp. HMSC14B06 TaxID=1581098 RepID=UPI00114D07C1|nr:hypothetical protein [Corynebacterium sp. HMSC14B06]
MNIGLGIAGAYGDRLTGGTDFLYNSQKLVKLRANIRHRDNDVDNPVIASQRDSRDIDDFAKSPSSSRL